MGYNTAPLLFVDDRTCLGSVVSTELSQFRDLRILRHGCLGVFQQCDISISRFFNDVRRILEARQNTTDYLPSQIGAFWLGHLLRWFDRTRRSTSGPTAITRTRLALSPGSSNCPNSVALFDANCHHFFNSGDAISRSPTRSIYCC